MSVILNQLIASTARTKLLEFFTRFPKREIHFNELQRELGINPRQLTLEMRKLTAIDFICERQSGKMKYYQANHEAYYFPTLQAFIQSLDPQQDDWFRWERASTIHALFIPIEAFVDMRAFTGFEWPENILIYTDENVRWHVSKSKLAHLGEKVVASYRTDQKKWEDALSQSTNTLAQVLDDLNGMNLESLSDRDLLSHYEQFRRTYRTWWGVFWPTEPVSVFAERTLRAAYPDMPPSDFSLLVAGTTLSFSQEVENAYSALVSLARAQDMALSNHEFVAALTKFRNDYYWIHNNYYQTQTLSDEDILLEVRRRREQEITPHTPASIDKQKLFQQYQVNPADQALISVLDTFIGIQDTRKKWMMRATHTLDKLLSEVGRRSGLTLKQMRYTLPSELGQILTGKTPPLNGRMRKFFIHDITAQAEITIHAGKAAIQASKQFEASLSKIPTKQIIQGHVACPGKAIGTVKVLMNPSEIGKINHGDVLVTSMTSPDFMVAMRKIVAIVTNEGGLTCHAAVISRELNLPCVIGTQNATELLKDGDQVEVDADTGLVRVLG